jgi:hypothetical protein
MSLAGFDLQQIEAGRQSAPGVRSIQRVSAPNWVHRPAGPLDIDAFSGGREKPSVGSMRVCGSGGNG